MGSKGSQLIQLTTSLKMYRSIPYDDKITLILGFLIDDLRHEIRLVLKMYNVCFGFTMELFCQCCRWKPSAVTDADECKATSP